MKHPNKWTQQEQIIYFLNEMTRQVLMIQDWQSLVLTNNVHNPDFYWDDIQVMIKEYDVLKKKKEYIESNPKATITDVNKIYGLC